MRFEFTIPLPPVLNKAYGVSRSGIRYKTPEAKEWQKSAGWLLREQMQRTGLTAPFYAPTDDIYMGIEIFYERDRDIDASLKLLLDLVQMPMGQALQGVGIIHDDAQIKHLNVKKYKDKNARVVVVMNKTEPD